MAAPRRIYLDTNVLIEIGEKQGSESPQLRRIILAASQADSTRFKTSELTQAEILIRPIRDQDHDLIGVYDNILTNGGTLDVGPIDRAITEIAAALRADHKSLKTPDAIHLATAFAFGCSHFLTYDLRISGKFDLPPDPMLPSRGRGYSASHSVQIVRPDEATLASLLAEFAD